MKTRRVLCLTEHITFHQPTSWDFHARYALQRGGGEVVIPTGTWLVELDPVETWPDQKTEYLYRTPSGEVLALESPLPERRYSEVTDPQVVTALNAFRSLGAILEVDFGVTLYQTCRELPPFALIQCPLCSGTSFTTLDLASAWCDRCNAAFQVRSTAGDPGFVIDVTWKNYNPLAARFVLPRTDKLLSTLVLKDSGDPRDMSRDHCSSECRAGLILLTDGSTGLRHGTASLPDRNPVRLALHLRPGPNSRRSPRGTKLGSRWTRVAGCGCYPSPTVETLRTPGAGTGGKRSSERTHRRSQGNPGNPGCTFPIPRRVRGRAARRSKLTGRGALPLAPLADAGAR